MGHPAKQRLLAPLLLAAAFIASVTATACGPGNSIEERLISGEPFAVRIALTSEDGSGSEFLAHAIFFPEWHQILLYVLNTDAATEEEGATPWREMAPARADRLSHITGIDADFYIHTTPENLQRLLDLSEGQTQYIDQPLRLDSPRFSYLPGRQYFPGEQLLDYIMQRSRTEPNQSYLSGVDRMFRAESLIATLFWRRHELMALFPYSEQRDFLYGLMRTNLDRDQYASLFSYIINHEGLQFQVMEVPLDLDYRNRNSYKLIVKEEQAREQFRHFLSRNNADTLRSSDFRIEVLNGTDTARLATRVQQLLSDIGMRVMTVDNYERKPIDESVILIRSANTFHAERLLAVTGLEYENVFFRRLVSEIDVTIIVGEDFDERRMHRLIRQVLQQM